MDSDRKAFLNLKRQLLKRETHLREMRDRITPELNFLQDNDLHYNLYYEYEHVNWINNHVKVRNKDGYRGSHGDFQIDVNDEEALYTEKGAEEDCFQFDSIQAFFGAISDQTMLIKCSLFGGPEIEITKYAFLSEPSLFLSGPETWVLSADKQYVIEKIFNKEVVRFIDLTQDEPVLQVKLLLD